MPERWKLSPDDSGGAFSRYGEIPDPFLNDFRKSEHLPKGEDYDRYSDISSLYWCIIE